MLLLKFIKMLLKHLLGNDFITQEQYDEFENMPFEDFEIEEHRKRLKSFMNKKSYCLNELTELFKEVNKSLDYPYDIESLIVTIYLKSEEDKKCKLQKNKNVFKKIL